jgi:hypothetical protein
VTPVQKIGESGQKNHKSAIKRKNAIRINGLRFMKIGKACAFFQSSGYHRK